MRIVDKTEAMEWLSLRGITDSEGRIAKSLFPRQATRYIEKDSGAKTGFARVLASHFSEFDESMLWIDEWGIWPTSENHDLFNGYRQSLGETRPVRDRPAHICTPTDEAAVFSLLSMVLYFVWGAVLAASSGEVVVRISHDEWVDVYAKDVTEHEEDLFATVKAWTEGQPE